jgi:hypothetical protein
MRRNMVIYFRCTWINWSVDFERSRDITALKTESWVPNIGFCFKIISLILCWMVSSLIHKKNTRQLTYGRSKTTTDLSEERILNFSSNAKAFHSSLVYASVSAVQIASSFMGVLPSIKMIFRSANLPSSDWTSEGPKSGKYAVILDDRTQECFLNAILDMNLTVWISIDDISCNNFVSC